MVGHTLGSYHILGEIGSGGMGVVYLAEHRHLGRKVAIKVLLKEFAGRPDLLERFFAEARATSMIQHPGIVGIFDCETDAQGQPYIVMEYLEGETLGTHLSRRGPLPTVEALTIARRVAEALGAAHARGIIHRDLKPDNVFMLASPAGAVKLVDFGIAKLTAEFHKGQQSRTQTGALMGTPLYMSPEQCRGSGAIDHRTDIYSLGCLLFEMLTGRPPFRLEGLGELVAAHLTQPPPGVRSLVPRISEAVDLAVQYLLRKSPAERPQTTGEVVALLRGLGAPSLAPPEATMVPAREGASAQPTTFRPGSTPPDTRRRSTTFQGSTGEINPAAANAGAAPARRSRSWLVGGALLLAAAGVAVMVLRPKSAPEATQDPATSPSVAAPESTTGTEPAASPPVPASPAVNQPSAQPRANFRTSGDDPPADRTRPGVGRSRGERPPVVLGNRQRRGLAREPAPEPNDPILVIIDSEPPGAEVCAVSDRRVLGYTSASVLVPRNVQVATFYVSFAGYHIKKIDVVPGRQKRHFVPLQPLSADDLDAPSPCVP